MIIYDLVRDLGTYQGILLQLDKSKPLFCDTETCIDEGLTKGGLYGKIRLFQIYQTGWDKAALLDCFFIDLQTVLEDLQDYHHVYHNASYDIHTINCYTDIPYIPRKLDDTLYLSRLSFFRKGSKFGFYQCLKYAGLADNVVSGLDKRENQLADWGGPLTPDMKTYAACDVVYLAKLWEYVQSPIDSEVYMLDIFNLRFAIEYSRRGIPVDQTLIRKQLGETLAMQEEILDALPVNPNSPKQCKEFLGTDKTDMDTLVHLHLEGSEQAGMIRTARQNSKTITFLKQYDRPIIKGFYNPCGAISGRFSCTGGDRFTHANLQQIARRILGCLKASKGMVLVYNDYTGLELRMAIATIGDPVMHRLTVSGTDMHTHTGKVVYGDRDLTDFERMIGKICNFLLIYGGSPYVLQATIRAWGGVLMSMKDVKVIYDAWMAEYVYFAEWHKMTKKAMNIYGYIDVSTALGRQVRAVTMNEALNIPIQGSSAEVNKTSLAILKSRYPNENLISTIHDSNTLMVPEDEAEDWISVLNEVMIEAWFHVIKDLDVPDLPMPETAQANSIWKFK